ncbi:MAG TPA: hypothetical protein VGL58_16965 [Caulobacteraceae bacterium]|jgi:hypothetical protein
MRLWPALGACLAVVAGLAAAAPTRIATVDLTKPSATRWPWAFTADQGPHVPDPTGMPSDMVPGVITLCLRDAKGACAPELKQQVRSVEFAGDLFTDPHFLLMDEVVGVEQGRPLFIVQTGSVLSGDGDQVVLTQVFAYRPASDRFARVYSYVTGHNNNQDWRYIGAGALAGDIISADPTANAPFGFWITVSKPGKAGLYAPALRYRSATRYQDGNPLGVIDSEMTNIEFHLGLWKPGAPPVLPAKTCAKPHLVKMELWCGPAVAGV